MGEQVRGTPRLDRVIAYAGYRGEQEPRAVEIEGQRREVARIADRWADPDADYFKVELDDGRLLLLRRSLENLAWSLVHAWRPGGLDRE